MAQSDPNAVGRMLGVLGDEWTLLVIQQALLGATRYADFMARLPISNSVLTRRLRTLSSDGLLERRAYQTNPPRSEYVVTADKVAVAGVVVDLGMGAPLGARSRRAAPRHAPHHLWCRLHATGHVRLVR